MYSVFLDINKLSGKENPFSFAEVHYVLKNWLKKINKTLFT